MHGKVVGVTDYGAFVQIEPAVEGLVHVSEMSWSKHMKHPSKIVKVGDEVDVVVLDVKPDLRRISLGLKQTLPDPWQEAAQKYPVGAIVNGRIRNLAEFGAFVELEEGMEGLIHISDVSWTERIKHPSEKFKKGEVVEAKVLKLDPQNRRLSLGVKQVNDIWANWFAAHKIGEVLKGKVARTTDFGAFVELAEGIEGLCHVSEIEERRPKGERDKAKASARWTRQFVARPREGIRFQDTAAGTRAAQDQPELSRRSEAGRAARDPNVPLVEIVAQCHDRRCDPCEAAVVVESVSKIRRRFSKRHLPSRELMVSKNCVALRPSANGPCGTKIVRGGPQRWLRLRSSTWNTP